MLVASTLGFIAATLAPLTMTIGFIIWGKSWQSTPFALNLFKCTLAGTLFMVISFCIPSKGFSSLHEQTMVIISSIIGIVVGDNTWLLALKIIGAKRVIVIDALKPFCAAFASYFILHEPLTVSICVGLAVSSIGVVMVATEKEISESISDESFGTENTTNESSEIANTTLLYGYVLAAINVILDAFGSVLTKQFGHSMNTWEINYLRFGFAAVFMALVSLSMLSFDAYRRSGVQDFKIMSESMHSLNVANSTSNSAQVFAENSLHHDLSSRGKVNGNETTGDIEMFDLSSEKIAEQGNELKMSKEESGLGEKWYAFPVADKMSGYEWVSVGAGVFFVTFLCPAMSNYALFKLPISLSLTLNSLGPIFSIPLVYIMLGEKSGKQAIIGSILAVGGIVIMCI